MQLCKIYLAFLFLICNICELVVILCEESIIIAQNGRIVGTKDKRRKPCTNFLHTCAPTTAQIYRVVYAYILKWQDFSKHIKIIIPHSNKTTKVQKDLILLINM